MARWRCNCIFCRLFVHPVLRRVGGLSEPRTTPRGVEESAAVEQPPERPVQAAPLATKEEETLASVTQEATPQAPILTQEILEGVISKVVENVRVALEENGKVLVERLDRIEENMGKLRKEIQSLVSSMENVIVEFREAISELTNPLLPSTMQQPVPTPATREPSASVPSISLLPSHLASFVRPLMQILDKVDEKLVRDIIDEYEKTGLITSEEARRLKTIVSTIARLREKGVDDETIMSMVAAMLATEVKQST